MDKLSSAGIGVELDYSPFGMTLEGRNWTATSENYRYGFNGKENEDDISGNNNTLDFGARIYDSRLGRFMSLDPRYRDYPWQSPYIFYTNNPILNQDINGEGGPTEEPKTVSNEVTKFTTPDNGTIYLPSEATNVKLHYSTGIGGVSYPDGSYFDINVAPNSLYAFDIGGKSYNSVIDRDGYFLGYGELNAIGGLVESITYEHSTIVSSHVEYAEGGGKAAMEMGLTITASGAGSPPAVIAAIATAGTVAVLSSLVIVTKVHNIIMEAPGIEIGGFYQAKGSKIETDSELEESLNQLEGIEKAQQNAKKENKSEKQNKINQTKKSEDRFKHHLNRLKDLDDVPVDF